MRSIQSLNVRVLGLAYFFAFGICPCASARISLGRPHMSKEPLKDDLKQCDEPVKKGIARTMHSPRWGAFHFDCGGTVYRIQAQLNSPIVREWPKFVTENAVLFGIDPMTVRPGQRYERIQDVEQWFTGALIIGPFGSGGPPYRKEGEDL